MNLLMAKSTIGFISSVSVGHVVGNIIKATTPIDIGKFQRISVMIGSVVLTGMVSNMADKYTTEVIDGAVATVKSFITK